MKILFVWTGVTSYMADCWRELQRLPDIELKVIIERVESGRDFSAAETLAGLDYSLVPIDGEVRLPEKYVPDILFSVGWHSSVVRRLVCREDWAAMPKICCFDMPWRASLRCFVARYVLRRFLRRYSAAYVPGELCAKYARWLGFSRVEKGLFALSFGKLRCSGSDTSRTGFLYVGRFSPEKRVDLIKKAYALYHRRGGTWRIDYFGQGGTFVQASEMPRLYHEHACLVLASAFDPWPLVSLEARVAGCAVICSERCGNTRELPGLTVVPYGDAVALADAMLRVEKTGGCTPVETNSLAMYDAEAWAVRTLALAKEVLCRG